MSESESKHQSAAKTESESVSFPRPLVAGEIAWCCDPWQTADGVISAEFLDEMALTSVLEPAANSLLLEHLLVDGRRFLVHRAGWPFDLKTLDTDPRGLRAAELRPRGAGEEVFRQLVDAIEAALPGVTLHIHHASIG